MQRTKLSNLATFNMGQSPSSSFISEDEEGIPFLQGNADFGPVHPEPHLYCQRPFKVAEKGDILVSVRAPVGALNKADQAYCIGRGLAAIRFAQTLSNFGWHLLNYWANDLNKTAQGSTFEAISKADLENLAVFSYENEEQHCISNILDTLDTQILQTQALIAKLKQVKAGLLHDLLTRGIDENGEIRDPVAHPEEFQETFYGKLKIPAQWNIYLLEKIAEISSGVTLGRNLKGSDTVELPYLRVANVQDGYLDLKEMKTIRVPKHEVDRFLLKPGDVLMTEGGDFDKLGRGTIWTGEIPVCLHQNHIFKVRTDSRYLHPEFLALLSRSSYGKHFFLLSSKQSTNLASINSTQLKGFPTLCPTKEEQEQIINIIHAQDIRVAAEESHLAKLKQVKKGLMDDLLTGRVRVTELIASDESLSI